MRIFILPTILFSLILGFSAVIFADIHNVFAQETRNQAILTWQANNYFPANYQGRALATNKTTINASVELVADQKIQNISNATIAWYIDGDFFRKGIGLKEISFPVRKTRGDSHTIRVSIKTGETEVGASASIPIFDPEVVIENGGAGDLIKGGSQITLQAIPYFFNISSMSDLSFSWKVNGSQKAADVSALTLNVGSPQTASQRNLLVEVFTKNLKNAFEFSKQQLKLVIL